MSRTGEELQRQFAIRCRLGRDPHYFGTVVPDIADLRIGFIHFHRFRFVRPQQVERQSFCLFPVQPAIVISRVQNNRHTRVYRRHQLVRLNGHDGERLQPIPSRSFQASHRLQIATGKRRRLNMKQIFVSDLLRPGQCNRARNTPIQQSCSTSLPSHSLNYDIAERTSPPQN